VTGALHTQIAAVNGVMDYFEMVYAHHFVGCAETHNKAREVNVWALVTSLEAVLP
jgi:hypothetical protein